MMLMLTHLSINAQQQENSGFKFDSKKLIFGGDIGFALSNDYCAIAGSPQIGYKLTDRFHIGAGFGYHHGKSDKNYYILVENENDDSYEWVSANFRYTENRVSINLFAHYYPWKKLILSLKPQIMHTWYRGKLGDEKYSDNKFVPAVTLGGGVHLRPVILQLNYEIIQDKYSPYSDNVFLSIGLMF